MNDDAALLLRYADDGSEAAFAEVVRRHVDLVYAAALRRTGGDKHRASDVAQQVFTSLARNARKLSRHAVLGAWLHTATRNAALNLMISEQRRQARELDALAHSPAIVSVGDGPSDWDQLRPVLDAAIDELPEADRAAVVLRFLERRPFAEIGVALHTSADAARMRTDRALEKLRAALARRGITSTAAALGAAVASQPVMSAPAGLAAALAAQSLTATAVGTGATFATFSALMSTKIIVTAATSALVFFALGTYFGVDYATSQPALPPPEMPEQARKIASLREQSDRLRAEVDRLTAVNASLSAPRPAPPAPIAPVARPVPTPAPSVVVQQRAILNNLRQLAAARDQFILENGRSPVSIDELVGETNYVRRLNQVAGENYSALLLGRDQPLIVTLPDGTSVTYDPAGENTTQLPQPPEPTSDEKIARVVAALGPKVGPALQRAATAYMAANNGTLPANPQALLPYFATPQEGADFVEAIETQKNAPR